MARLGLFPLPLVLVPTERVPLHIFEPRYRELIGECIERDVEFGILLKKPGGEGSAVGTRATVVDVLRRLPDGRLHIVVEGGERFRVVELHHDRSFLEGTTEPVTDAGDPPADDDVEKVLELFGRLQETVGSTLEPPAADSPLLDYEIVSRVDFGNDEKQELIELTSPRRRYARLVELLEHALEALTLERAVMKSAATNGKVTPLSGD
jgi:ATP-dependent Lon protease